MDDLNLRIQELDSALNSISDILNSMTEDNIDITLESLNSQVKKYLALKNGLQIKYPGPVNEKYELTRKDMTKHINQKFDNIIGKIRTEKDLIKTKLENIQNQKKLSNYSG